MRLRRRPAQPFRPPRPSRIGTAVVDLAGTDPTGSTVRRSLQGSSGPTLLLFLTSSCEPCQGLWQALAAGRQSDLPGSPPTVVVTPSAALEDRRRVAELAPGSVPVVMSGEAWQDYGVPGSPFAVMVHEGRVAGEGPVLDWGQLAALLG
jgi:hypothetical protein